MSISKTVYREVNPEKWLRLEELREAYEKAFDDYQKAVKRFAQGEDVDVGKAYQRRHEAYLAEREAFQDMWGLTEE